ncbi:MAG: hypothetical protein AAB250_01910, partial [Bdellovibrionota bacterium]
QVRFYDLGASGNNFVAFRAPDSIASDVVWSLPAADGTVGQVLKTDGAGSLSWTAVGSGNGDFLRDGSLSMTGQFLATVGSSLTPGVSFGGDNDTGMYQAGANSLAFSTAGQQRMRLDSNGNVGIGTSAPNSLLHLNGGGLRIDRDDANPGVTLRSYGVANQPVFYGMAARGTTGAPTMSNSGDQLLRVVADGYGATTYARSGELNFIAAENFTDTAGGSDFVVSTSPLGAIVPTEKMRVTAAGYVGIGTTSPTSKLSIYSGDDGSMDSIQIHGGSLSTTRYGVLNVHDSSEYIRLGYYNGATMKNVFLDGNVGIGTTAPISELNVYRASGSVGATVQTASNSQDAKVEVKAGTREGSIKFHGSTHATLPNVMQVGTTGSSGMGQLSFVTADAAERMRIDASGNVGIGTTTPTTALDVNGAIKIAAATNTCSASTLGALRLNSDAIEFCTNSTWTPMGLQGGSL